MANIWAAIDKHDRLLFNRALLCLILYDLSTGFVAFVWGVVTILNFLLCILAGIKATTETERQSRVV